MYAMKPILEPDVLDLLNNGRFIGEMEGYILSDGKDLFGWSLFRIDGDVTYLLDILPPSDMFMDGLIRASVAYGEARGASSFMFNKDNEHLMKYKRIFFEEEGDVISNDKLFVPCEGEE